MTDGEHRDALLLAAQDTVARARRDGLDPLRLTPLLLAAWAAAGGPAVACDDDFQADPRTGVEALAFVAEDGGGLVLRLPGELPDSFEAVVLPGPATPAHVRAAWFAARG